MDFSLLGKEGLQPILQPLNHLRKRLRILPFEEIFTFWVQRGQRLFPDQARARIFFHQTNIITDDPNPVGANELDVVIGLIRGNDPDIGAKLWVLGSENAVLLGQARARKMISHCQPGTHSNSRTGHKSGKISCLGWASHISPDHAVLNWFLLDMLSSFSCGLISA